MIDFECQKGAKREAFGEPKRGQNRPQNETKSKSMFKSEQIHFKTVLEPSWSRLGPILGHLGRTWGHLGAILGRLEEPKSVVFLRIFTICFEKLRFYMKMVILAGLEAILRRVGSIMGPLGPNLGRFGRPKGRPKGTQEAPKTSPK